MKQLISVGCLVGLAAGLAAGCGGGQSRSQQIMNDPRYWAAQTAASSLTYQQQVAQRQRQTSTQDRYSGTNPYGAYGMGASGAAMGYGTSPYGCPNQTNAGSVSPFIKTPNGMTWNPAFITAVCDKDPAQQKKEPPAGEEGVGDASVKRSQEVVGDSDDLINPNSKPVWKQIIDAANETLEDKDKIPTKGGTDTDKDGIPDAAEDYLYKQGYELADKTKANGYRGTFRLLTDGELKKLVADTITRASENASDEGTKKVLKKLGGQADIGTIDRVFRKQDQLNTALAALFVAQMVLDPTGTDLQVFRNILKVSKPGRLKERQGRREGANDTVMVRGDHEPVFFDPRNQRGEFSVVRSPIVGGNLAMFATADQVVFEAEAAVRPSEDMSVWIAKLKQNGHISGRAAAAYMVFLDEDLIAHSLDFSAVPKGISQALDKAAEQDQGLIPSDGYNHHLVVTLILENEKKTDVKAPLGDGIFVKEDSDKSWNLLPQHIALPILGDSGDTEMRSVFQEKWEEEGIAPAQEQPPAEQPAVPAPKVEEPAAKAAPATSAKPAAGTAAKPAAKEQSSATVTNSWEPGSEPEYLQDG